MADAASIAIGSGEFGQVLVTTTDGGAINLTQGDDIIALDAKATRKLSEVLMAATFGFGMTEEQD